MSHFFTLAEKASNTEIMETVDQWVVLLSQRKFAEALIAIPADSFWSAELLAEVIDKYDDGEKNEVTVTNDGTSIDGAGNVSPFTQRKEVDWFDDGQGAVWYDLNINGHVSDLTATFGLEKNKGQLLIRLHDIHIM
ncbi:MAG: hypothetical protein EOO63_09140 [Hymenobacter sp.]|nr:MAG: hypothetical protein EOO63_09140 [Hymenobacter sp.]